MTEAECRNGAFRVAALLRVVAEHDQATYLHGVRVAELCREIGEVMELSEDDLPICIMPCSTTSARSPSRARCLTIGGI